MPARNFEQSPPPEQTPQTKRDTAGEDQPDAVEAKAAQRKERRERRNGLERWNQSLEDATGSEVYHIAKGLTEVFLLHQSIHEKKLQRGERVSEERIRTLADMEARLQIARDVRAEKNGWTKEGTADLRERLQQERGEVTQLEEQFDKTKAQLNLGENLRDASYRNLPAGLEVGDVLRIIRVKQIESLNNIATIERILKSREGE